MLPRGWPIAWAFSHVPMVLQASEAWNRGQVVGQTPVKRSVALLPAPAGYMFLVWPNLDGRLELAHIGVDGEVMALFLLF